MGLTHLCSPWTGHTFSCRLEAGLFMALNFPVSPAPSAPQALLAVYVLEDRGGGTSLKPQSSSHQMIPPSPQKHSCFPPISKEEVSSLLLSKTNFLSTSSRTWHPQAPHPPAWTYSTEDSEGPEDAGEQVLSRGPCGREKEPQPIPLCPKQGPQPPASSLSSCTGLPRPFRLLAVPQNHATCNHLLSV